MTDDRPSMYRLKQDGLPTRSVSVPVEGCYEMRYGEQWVPVRIWYGPSYSPEGEEMDRSPCWHAVKAGKEVEVFDVWPWCSGRVITMDQYRTMLMEGLDNV